jgi:hypothetical protein
MVLVLPHNLELVVIVVHTDLEIMVVVDIIQHLLQVLTVAEAEVPAQEETVLVQITQVMVVQVEHIQFLVHQFIIQAAVVEVLTKMPVQQSVA